MVDSGEHVVNFYTWKRLIGIGRNGACVASQLLDLSWTDLEPHSEACYDLVLYGRDGYPDRGFYQSQVGAEVAGAARMVLMDQWLPSELARLVADALIGPRMALFTLLHSR